MTTWAWVRRITEIAPTVRWALAAAGAAIMIMYFPRILEARATIERQRAQEITEENRAYCEKWGLKAGTHFRLSARGPYTRSRPACNLSDQILKLGIESGRGLKQSRIFVGHHQRRWQVIDDRHALAILVLHQKQLDGCEQRSLKVVSYHGNCDDRTAKNPPHKLSLNTI